MIKQLEFVEKREITSGQNQRGNWILYGYKEANGYEYTTFDSNFPLNAPIEIEYIEEEKMGRGGQTLLSRRITKQIGGETPKAKNLQGEQILAKLEELQEAVEEIKQWTRSK